MGEAKRRGTREERVLEAVEHRQQARLARQREEQADREQMRKCLVIEESTRLVGASPRRRISRQLGLLAALAVVGMTKP